MQMKGHMGTTNSKNRHMSRGKIYWQNILALGLWAAGALGGEGKGRGGVRAGVWREAVHEDMTCGVVCAGWHIK